MMTLEPSLINWLVTFPRTGTHWLNCVIELYYGDPMAMWNGTAVIPKQITFLTPLQLTSPVKWLGTHDANLDMTHDPNLTIYLYRNPVDVVFSSYQVMRKSAVRNRAVEPPVVKPEFVTTVANNYRVNLEKYLLTTPARTIVKYERFVSDRLSEFSKVITHFGDTMDVDRATVAWDAVTKKAMAIKAVYQMQPFFNFEMNSDSYATERTRFAAEWGSTVNSLVISPSLSPLFPDLSLSVPSIATLPSTKQPVELLTGRPAITSKATKPCSTCTRAKRT